MTKQILPILGVRRAQVPERIVVVGDPARVDTAACHLDDVEHVGQSREYRVLTGWYDGHMVGVVSHGVGAAGAALCFEDLCSAGATHIVRAGSAGGLQDVVDVGDVVVATAAVRDDGLTPRLVPESFPAVADLDLTLSLREAAHPHGVTCHCGIVLTSDLFFPHDVLGSDLERWQRAGVIAVEMECSALFVIAALNGVRAAAVLAVDGNPLRQDAGSMSTYDSNRESVRTAVDAALRIALTAVTSG